MRVAVQQTAETTVQIADLDRMAEHCIALGHEVSRFRAPAVPDCDVAIIWDGVHTWDRPIARAVRDAGRAVLYIGYGWFPPTDTYQLSWSGVDYHAAWSNEPLPNTGPAVNVGAGPLLVTLQSEHCWAKSDLSPWFKTNRQFLEFLRDNSRLPVLARAHPKDDRAAEMRDIEGIEWDGSPDISAAMSRCLAVATITSKCGLDAMAGGLPVLCYGRAAYRRRNAAYCLTDRPMHTWAVTELLRNGYCDLRRSAQRAVVADLRRRQVPKAKLKGVLAKYLGQGSCSPLRPRPAKPKRIVVVYNPHPLVRLATEAFAKGCQALGHVVRFWHAGQEPPIYDVLLVWNGTGKYWQNRRPGWAGRGVRVLCMEHGWLPQQSTVQIDADGPNALASWAETPLDWQPEGRPSVAGDHLLVICQRADDSQLRLLSPHFPHMAEWLEFLSATVEMPMLVRPHPRALRGETERYEAIVSSCPLMEWDTAETLAEAMRGARAVVTINSTCGLEALDAGLPVLCYGRAVYRHPGAVVCLDADPANTRLAIDGLRDGMPELDTAAMRAAVERAKAKQIPIAELAGRVGEYLG